MSDTTYLGRKMQRFSSTPQFDGYSRVVITVSDEIEYSAGTELGRTLRLTCPWGTPEMAQNLLNDIRGFQYQPYTAENAFIDPAVELGDGVTANNVYGGIYTKKIKFGPLLTATVSAPEDEELDHEYPYTSKQDRQITRQFNSVKTQFKVQDGLISAEVEARKSDTSELRAAITVEAGRITQEITDRKSDTKTLTSKITQEAGRITQEITDRKSDTKTLTSKITQEANRITQEISDRKSDTESLTSKITQEAGRITQEITDRTNAISSVNSTISQQASQISARVTKTGGNYSSFGWNLTDSYWELQSGSSAVLRADKNGLEVRGKINALSGKIGGFDIMSNYLSYNGQTWCGTNTYGAYLGVNGLQLGRNFQVDMAGNLYAASGTFSGSVYAGNIQYGGGSYGTMSGELLTSGSVSGGYGGAIGLGTITTSNTTPGINTSLGYADFANGVFNEYNQASVVWCASIRIGNARFAPKTLYYKDQNNVNRTAIVLGV